MCVGACLRGAFACTDDPTHECGHAAPEGTEVVVVDVLVANEL